ncbi:abc transporter [Colletotrichum incanum]|uniref:Abc transporter n=1 Tax=Colletotrichum incanum TaxID=1573173 RepID=A0A166LD10_COLIC|nr:abc transporter [Colletotrichum incanum]
MQLRADDGPKFEFRQGAIAFVDVEYKSVLTGLNLRVESGRTLSIIGPSGVGKSTILNLLLVHIRASSGHIQVDDQDIEDIDFTLFEPHVSIVGQRSQLFSSSVMENMRFVNSEATEEQVHEACRKARIHDVIMERPKRYDSEVGKNEQNFSGGEKQRLLIARLFLQRPDIIALDEATSALDAETEASVQKAIREAFTNTTIIQIE